MSLVDLLPPVVEPLSLELFGQVVFTNRRLPFDIGYGTLVPTVLNGSVNTHQAIRNVTESNPWVDQDQGTCFPRALLQVVRRSLERRRLPFDSVRDQCPSVFPVNISATAIPERTREFIQNLRYATFEFQNPTIQSRFIHGILETFPSAEIAILCASRSECEHQESLLSKTMHSTRPYAVDINSEVEAKNRHNFEEEKKKLSETVHIPTCPRLVIGTPDGLAKHDWGHIGTKQFLLVTDRRLFGKNTFFDYVLASPLESCRLYFLDTARTIWTDKYSGQIKCSVGPFSLLTDKNLGIIEFPTIRSINLNWELPRRTLDSDFDIWMAMESSKHRRSLVFHSLEKLANEIRDTDIVVLTASEEVANEMHLAFIRKSERNDLGIRFLSAEQFRTFIPSRATTICWTGGRPNIHRMLDTFVRHREGAYQVHWIDFADFPTKSANRLPPIVGAVTDANRRRRKTYKEFGFVPYGTQLADFFIDKAEKELIHA